MDGLGVFDEQPGSREACAELSSPRARRGARGRRERRAGRAEAARPARPRRRAVAGTTAARASARGAGRRSRAAPGSAAARSPRPAAGGRARPRPARLSARGGSGRAGGGTARTGSTAVPLARARRPCSSSGRTRTGRAAPREPSGFCGLYSTSILAKLNDTESIGSGAPSAPTVWYELTRTSWNLNVRYSCWLLAGLAPGERGHLDVLPGRAGLHQAEARLVQRSSRSGSPASRPCRRPRRHPARRRPRASRPSSRTRRRSHPCAWRRCSRP